MPTGDDFYDDLPEADKPNISIRLVEEALNLLVYVGEAKKPPKALLNLAQIDKLLEDPTLPPMDEKREYVLETLLTHIVQSGYTEARIANGLPPLPQPLTESLALADLNALMRRHADESEISELIAWAILYYQYIFVDAPFDDSRIGDALAMIPKTRRRHKVYGIKRIVNMLATAEQVARAEFLRRQLYLEIPQPPSWGVVGRNAWLDEAMTMLTQPKRLLITGDMGIGKRTVARALARRLIDSGQVERVLRITKPANAEAFRNRLVQKALNDYGVVYDLRTYLQNARMVIVVEQAEQLLHDQIALEEVLREIDVAMVIMTSLVSIPQPQINTQRVLPPIHDDYLLKLGKRMWSHFQPDEPVEGEIEALVLRAGGNPQRLQALLQGYRFTQEQTFTRETLQQKGAHLFGLLTMRGRLAWSALTLVPEEGVLVDDLVAIWGEDVAYDGVDELRRCYAANVGALSNSFALVGGLYTWALPVWDEQAHPWLNSLSRLDEALVNGVESAARLVTACLARRDLPLSEARRHKWLLLGWWRGVALNERALWLELLREATVGIFVDDARLWLGRGVCARGLTLWEESAAAFEQAIVLTGAIDMQDFALQSEVRLERGILRRMTGNYQRAVDDFAAARRGGARYDLPQLAERAALEQAQIALEMRKGGDALEWIKGIGQSAQRLLIEGEAHMLNSVPKLGLTCIEAALSYMEEDRRLQGRAYALMGRGLAAERDYEEARLAFDRAIMLLEGVGDVYNLARAYTNLGALMIEQGEAPSAIIAIYERAAAEQRHMGDLVGLRATQHNLAILRAKGSNTDTGH